MRNLKKCISLILVMLLMSLQISVFAESKIEDVKIEYDRETGDVTVSGKAPFAGNLEEPARLLILKPGTNADDLISGKVTYTEVGIHVDETTKPTDADLSASVTIKIGGFQNLIAKAAQ